MAYTGAFGPEPGLKERSTVPFVVTRPTFLTAPPFMRSGRIIGVLTLASATARSITVRSNVSVLSIVASVV